jgi:hypothetical protein
VRRPRRLVSSRPAHDEEARVAAFLELYNQHRPHRWCFGKTPMQTFVETVPLAKEKLMREEQASER